jgi:N-acetyl-beta-hexosaminidase
VYTFLDEVIGEIAAMTPGRYFHVGGDEVKTLTPEQYIRFIDRVQQIVVKHHKFAIRLGRQAPRWTALGVNFYRAPQIRWVS